MSPPKRRTDLDYSEIAPLAVDRFQLVDPAIVGVQEVAAIRDRVVVGSADRTASPAAATRSSPAAAMFAGFFAEFDAVLHFIFDTGKTGWNQPPITFQLFFGHNVYSTQKPGKRFAGKRRPPVGCMIFGTRTQGRQVHYDYSTIFAASQEPLPNRSNCEAPVRAAVRSHSPEVASRRQG